MASIKASVHVKAAGGNPQALAATLEPGKKALFSSTLGRATGFGKSRTEDIRDKGTFHDSLDGYFEVMNEDSGDVVSSSILYAPSTIHEQVVDILKANPGAQVKVAYESYVAKGGTAGFTWEHELKTDAKDMSDPLADIRGLLSKKPVAKELPAPEAKKGK
jgi:hypothetical protein